MFDFLKRFRSPSPVPTAPSPVPAQRRETIPAYLRAAPLLDTQTRIRLREIMVNRLTPEFYASNNPRTQLEEMYDKLLEDENITISRSERRGLLEFLLDDFLGLGPLELLLRDDNISEIMVDGAHDIHVRYKGELVRVGGCFVNEEHILRVLDRILAPLGYRISESAPMIETRMMDGSHLSAVIRPLVLNGATLTIKKPMQAVRQAANIEAMPPEARDFLVTQVAGANILISGNMGSGKTTLLNLLLTFTAPQERIVIIERHAEIDLELTNDLRLEFNDVLAEQYSFTALVKHARTMDAQRLVIGELEGEETAEWLDALNSGTRGCMATILADNPQDAVDHLASFCLARYPRRTLESMHEHIACGLDLIIHQARLADGSRRITDIVKVDGISEKEINLKLLYQFVETGIEAGRFTGKLQSLG